MAYDSLQLREAFHLSFLQEFLRKFDPKLVVLKGGVNLRFFFKSRRYSEDMDLDVRVASIASVQNNVLRVLKSIAFSMKTFGVREIIPPSLQKAKQTETTQRFKIHLVTSDGLDLFTKIEFSRRGFKGETVMERIDEGLLRSYRLGSVIVQHYDAASAYEQKIGALADRSEVQARDVFDLHLLRAFLPEGYRASSGAKLRTEAVKRAGEISFDQYKSSVVSYLASEDQGIFGSPEAWEEMKRVVVEGLQRGEGS